MSVRVTDLGGQERVEWVGVELLGRAEWYRFVRPDGSSELFNGDELRAALEPDREVRAA